MSRARLLAAAALCVLASACNDTVEPLDLASDPIAIGSVSGDAQIGGVSSELPLPLTVRATDADGRPVPGVVIAWTVSDGTLSQPADTTGNDGVASVRLTLPPASGPVTVTAAANGLTPVTFTATASPSIGILTFRYIDAGSYHACGITTSEESICWGYNEDGQVGTGAFSTIAPMTRVSTDRTVRMSSAGRHHSCEVTLAGEVWCGGSNAAGQLDGTVSGGKAAFFGAVTMPVATTFRVAQSGLLHTCALSLSKQLWCWGSNGEGQVGVGPTAPLPGTSVPPVEGFVGDGFNAVTSTGLHTCALTTSGQARCWGWNASGQLGDGTRTTSGDPVLVAGFTFRTEPAVVPPPPDPDFYIPGQAFISAGFAHTCGITTADDIVCWGENENGQLGRGDFDDATSPSPIGGALDWRAVSAGFNHTCALTTGGAAWCWGNNDVGQLGDGTRTGSNVPVAVSGGLTFQSISAGETFTCGVTTAGAAWCWGDNTYGQLGVTGVASATAPVKLPFQP